MMKKRCFRKLILLLLVTLLGFSTRFGLSVNSVSSEVPEDYVPSTQTTDDSIEAFSIEAKDEILLKQELGELTFEIESMREENVKHLRLEDGTFLAVVYGDSVHRKSSEGEWEEIDNSLYEINGALSTSDGRVKFAKQTTDLASLFTLQEGNYKVSFGLKNAKEDTAVAVTNAKTEPDIDATKLQRLTTVEKITSSIIYENIVDNIDIEYILVSNSIKENIIVKKPSRTYDYSFTLSLDGLVAELNGGDIILSDSDTREVVYQIPAPYMYDAVNEYSTKVAYSISSLGHGDNDNIQFGFDIFVHEDDGTTYTLESENVWNRTQKFSWNTIQSELDAGRPIMLGFGPDSPYGGGHMTVCVGYKIINDDYVVYVSDAHQEQYRPHLFSSSTYNDFFAIVLLVQE